jgi:hypothetical protein
MPQNQGELHTSVTVQTGIPSGCVAAMAGEKLTSPASQFGLAMESEGLR